MTRFAFHAARTDQLSWSLVTKAENAAVIFQVIPGWFVRHIKSRYQVLTVASCKAP